jgi:endonuclease/exonuclease/phosphatase (EEP) superfamily protein YafD
MAFDPKKTAATLLGLGAAAVSIPLVLGFLGALHPGFDSLSHFRLHLAAALLAAGVLLLPFRGWRLNGAIAIALAIAAAAATLLPAWHAAPANAASDGPTFRLLQMNLRFDNPRPDEVIALLRRERPDVATLEEVSPMWVELLAATEDEFPYRMVCPPHSYIGSVAILSRHPFTGEAPACSRYGSLVTATIDFDGRAVEIAALHLGWPWPFGQDRQVPRLAPALAALGEDAILAGDFNATPWSGTVHDIAAAGGLTLAPWIGPSYLDRRLPSWLRPLIGLPIDHVMEKGSVRVVSVRRLAEAGSDHLPVVVEWAVGNRQ